MPESRIRRRRAFTPPTEQAAGPRPSPRWWAPVMLALLVLGLLWIVVFYVSERAYPVPGLDFWNLVIGFGIVMVGFLMTTRWR